MHGRSGKRRWAAAGALGANQINQFFMQIKDIAQALVARIEGDGGLEIDRLVHPDRAERASDLALAMSGNAVAALAHSKARAAVVAAKNPVPANALKALITVDDPRMALAPVTALVDPGPAQEQGVPGTDVAARPHDRISGDRLGRI